MNEAQIIADCRNGSRSAQKILFESYSKRMLLLCRRYVKDDHFAQEILLNGFLNFFTTIDRFKYEDNKSVDRWLTRIIVNECLLFLRKNKRMIFLGEESLFDNTLTEDVFERMNVAIILQLINNLPDGYRVVFNLYVIEGYNHREIAELLDITEGGSKSQLSRAKKYLQTLLQKEGIVYEQK
jgi:RNA polymerase sigma factor (sigma-70 family)